jgi:hypothetical protein
MLRYSILLLVPVLVGASDEPLPKIFDLPLGEPVPLPECQHSDLGGHTKSKSIYAEDQPTTCQVPAGVEFPSRPNAGAIIFARLKAPWFIKSNRIETLVVEGRLEGVEAVVKPITASSGLAMELINKFGIPTQNGTEPVTTGGLPMLHMAWDRPAYVVDYTAKADVNTAGTFRVETSRGRALRLGGNPADGDRVRL